MHLDKYPEMMILATVYNLLFLGLFNVLLIAHVLGVNSKIQDK
jgi:uncharacterized membrane protein YuzA (DUF378 family)